jgi:hypothetical protein
MDEIEPIPAPTPEIIATTPVPEGKVYRDKVIYRATFLGGPLVAGYMMASNFKVFGENEKAKWTWFWTIFFTVALFGTLFFLPQNLLDKTPKYIIPLLYSIATLSIVKHYQGQKIDAHLSAGGQKYNGWRAFTISLIGLAIILIPVLGTYYVFNSELSTTRTYGSLKHTIAFDEKNISSMEVDSIANALSTTGFFDEAQQKEVFVKKIGNAYEISIPCNSSIKDNQESITPFVELRNNLQALIPAHKIVLLMVIDNLDNVYKRLE